MAVERRCHPFRNKKPRSELAGFVLFTIYFLEGAPSLGINFDFGPRVRGTADLILLILIRSSPKLGT